MDELILKIDDVVGKLIGYDQEGYAVAMDDLANSLISALPTIVSYYTDPRMEEYREDALYWPQQYERIFNATKAGDDLAVADILYNETRANLEELAGILKEKGMI